MHIGDNEISDYKTVLEHGITPYRIASSKELMCKSGLSSYFGEISGVGDSMMVGLFLEKTLSNPFALGAWNGKLYIDSMYDFGYLFFGPLILQYLLWLKEEAKTNKIDTILFVARDGYLLEKIYQKVADIDSTSSIYYLSSRRASSLAALNDERDIWFVFDKMCTVVSVKYETVLKKCFGIEIAISDELFGKTISEIGKEKMFNHTCKRYVKDILQNAEIERNNYLKYVSGLQLGENIGFVNFVGRGVTQYWTEKMLQRKMKGFYFAVENDIIGIYPDINSIFCLYPKFQSIHTSKFNLASKCLYGETILTGPTGTVIRFDQNGEPVFEERNRKQFALISECHKGIERYVDDMLEQLKNVPEMKFSLEMVDKLLGLFGEENIILSDEIKSVLKFEDYYGNR